MFDLENTLAYQEQPQDPELSYFDYHRLITANLDDWKDGYEYIDKCSPYYRVPTIKKPTLFLNSLNDPFISSTLDYEVMTKN